MSAAELDRKFDDGEDIDEYIDWSSARRPGLEAKRVNVDFPTWVVDRLDREARRLGVTRQSLIKMWIAERLQ
ncbi:CopG family antitoxin [Devosia sp.]|uniref:type II toxin-antitoxin system BrnA family antitoxin n=1 Tax=Devosia sp. TaxID=1871048 RepID=UPI00345C0377